MYGRSLHASIASTSSFFCRGTHFFLNYSTSLSSSSIAASPPTAPWPWPSSPSSSSFFNRPLAVAHPCAVPCSSRYLGLRMSSRRCPSPASAAAAAARSASLNNSRTALYSRKCIVCAVRKLVIPLLSPSCLRRSSHLKINVAQPYVL